MNSQKGFSLIEMIMVTAIIGILATILILNFRAGSGETALRQVAQQISSDVRRAQTMALSGRRYDGQARCGYGVTQIDEQTYQIYVGPDSQGVDCHSITEKNFDTEDQIVETIGLIDSQISIVGTFPDIFFEPPNPTTYIDNNDLIASTEPAEIILTTDAEDIKKIWIYPSGLIEIE